MLGRAKRRGFTLIEILAVGGVTVLLFGLVIRIFFSSQDAVSHTVDKVQAVQSARQLVDKLAPIVAVACDPKALSARPVTLILPEDGLDEEMRSPTAIELVTAENLLSNQYLDQRPTFQLKRNLHSFRFRITYNPEEEQLLLQQMSSEDPTEIDTDIPPRPLATGISGLQFAPLVNDDSLIRVTVRVMEEPSQRQTGNIKFIQTTAVLPVISESLR